MNAKKSTRQLRDSPYNAMFNGWTFYFSSEYNMEKFCDDMDEEIERLSVSFNHRYGFTLNFRMLYIVIWYMRVEKVGFRIETEEGVVMLCPQSVCLNGDNPIKRI